MAYGIVLKAMVHLTALAAVACGYSPANGQAQRVRITGLSDVNFGQVLTVADVSVAQDICVFSSTMSGAYHVVATGGGTGGSFQLFSATNDLAYEVQWAESSGQASGTTLQAGIASTVFYSNAQHHRCNSGPATSATLIVKLPGDISASASAGSYVGTLSITIIPD